MTCRRVLVVPVVLVALLGGDAPAQETGDAGAGAGSATRAAANPAAEDPGLEQVRLALRTFRRITREANLLPESGAARPELAAAAGSALSWHGRVFEYFRNDVLDAVPHEVVQRGGERNLRRRNQFGFTVNGPVLIPGLYSGRGKSFFTFSYEGTRERVGRSYLYTVPTLPQRTADFSDLVNRAGRPLTVYDPASTRRNAAFDRSRKVSAANLEYRRDPFPGNRIPLTRLDSVATAAIRHYPGPNAEVGPFLRNNYWTNPSERSTPDGFILRLDHSLGAVQKVDVSASASDGLSDTPDLFPTVANPGRPDRVFQDRAVTVTDTVTPTPNLTYRGQFRAGLKVVDTLALAPGGDLPADLGLRGVGGTVFPALRFRGYVGLGASSQSYLRNAFADYSLDNQFTVRRGGQTWTFVSEAELDHWNTLELRYPSGSFSFDDRMTGLPGVTNTGDGFATFLLGAAWRAESTDQVHPAYLRRSSFENALSSQWQVSPNLTLSYGVTVAASGPRTEAHDRQSTFDPNAVNPAAAAKGALVFAGRDGRRRAFQPYRVRAEPRVGISWSPTAERDAVVRGSVSRYVSPVGLRSGPFATQGFSGVRYPVSPNRQLVPAVKLDQGFPPLPNPLPDLRPGFANNANVDMIPQTGAQPTYTYFSLELEQKLPKGLVLRARGRTIRARDLLIGGHIAGLNNVPVEALAHRDRLNEEGFRRALRPFPHVQQIQMNYQYPAGKYRYDEGRVEVQKRTGDGLSLNMDYRFRKRWDDYSGPGIQDPSDRGTAWALGRGLSPQRFALTYTYELPFGRGRSARWGSELLAKLVSDWSVSGYTTWLSGDPVVLEPLFNNTGGIVPYLRVDAVPGTDPHVAEPGPEGWFNPQAFVDPPDFALGGVPRTHPTLRNPDYRNHDVAITKRVVVSQEQSVEIIVESFNFVNQGNWNNPDGEIGPDRARNANAGKIIGSRGGRVLQLGLRYNF